MQALKEIAFGGFRLDFTNECLWDEARAISLRPKAFAVLRLLVEHPGLLVTKQQVLDAVWPGTYVGDGVLKDSIRQLREALHDDAGAPAYIETAHRRGYRFIGKLIDLAPKNMPSADAQVSASGLSKNAQFTSSATVQKVLGRDAELGKMRGWLERALAGERQTIFITGEPGIGKTTIVQAFLEEAAQIPGLLVARGQCLEHYGVAEAYLPILDGFSRLCRSRDGAQVLNALRQHAPAWMAQMPSLISQAERESPQAHVVPTTRERMLREMAEAIETISSESPLLLVLEDLHWSDYSTLDLISYLARRQDPARLAVIGTYRPVDVIVDDHPIKGVKRELQAHGLCHELPLEYLDEDAVSQYIEARFPGNQFPARLHQTIFGRTEGNPLFMVNLIQYLIDEKLVVEEHGASSLRVDLSEVEQGVPANLRQLIEKQIERLSPDERTVLEAASVAGTECSSIAIAAGLDAPVDWVEKQCEELARRHQFLSSAWLVELPDGTITPRHRFVHILHRDVPYRLIPAMRRSQIHQRIGERGVAIYGNRSSEIAAELAMHFEQSRDWPRAVEYLLQAAENATRKSAHHEATDLAKRGLVVLKSLSKSGERDQQEIALRMILTLSLMAVKGFASAEVEEVYKDGEELFRSSEPSPRFFKGLYLLGLFRMFGGKTRAALEIADQVLDVAERLEDPTLIMEAHRARGATLLEIGRCAEALEHLDRASHLYSASDHHSYTPISGRDCKVSSECAAGKALWALGVPDAALRRMQAGLEFARELAHPQSVAYAAHFASQLHQLRGEPLLAQHRAKEVIRVSVEYGLELWLAFGRIDLGWANAELGDVQQGIEQMHQGLAAYEVTGGQFSLPYFLGLLADQQAKTGHVQEGLATVTKAISIAEHTGEGYSLAELHRIKGELLIRAAEHRPMLSSAEASSMAAQAQSCFVSALTVAKQHQAISWELKIVASMERLKQQSLHATG